MESMQITNFGAGLFIMSTIVAQILLAKLLQDEGTPKTSLSSAQENSEREVIKELTAVNFHFTRQCNYSCGFCFHTAKTSHIESLDNCKKILRELRLNGCRKINFAGGEPFLNAKLLGEMIKYAKLVCKYESVSIISNGSKLQESWFQSYGDFLDILGVSCDSINEDVNVKIGRGKGNHLEHIRKAQYLCAKYNILFKINTVVNSYNVNENMAMFINELKPMRWKLFQVLPLEGENIGDDTKRDVTPFLISEADFQEYILRNQKHLEDQTIMKVESNTVMQSSYVLVDEFGCFLDSSTGGKRPTQSILNVGVSTAFKELISSEGGGFDSKSFDARDGDYKTSYWAKSGGCASVTNGSHTLDLEDLYKQ